MGGTPFCKGNSFIDTARDVGSQGSGCKPMLADVMNRGREEWFAKKGKKNRDLGEKRRENRGKKKGELTRSGVSNQTSPEVSSPL